MSRFTKVGHVLYHCQYHLVWVPKYRYRILTGGVGNEVEACIRQFVSQLGCKIVEMSIRADHVHLVVDIPPKVSVSEFVGTIKGRTAIRVFKKFSRLKQKPYWGNHFWARGYCVDTVGLDSEKIVKYVRYQQAREEQDESEDTLL